MNGTRSVRVAVDAMGSDEGPQVVVAGAVMAARESGDRVQVVLVGDESPIWSALTDQLPGALPIFVVHAPQQVEMGEKAPQTYRSKPQSSIAVCADLVHRGRADALVSTGNTGAVVTTALLTLGRMSGIKRPAIASMFPTRGGPCVILDVGANADVRPLHLYQFAVMGRLYAQLVLGIEAPRVGLLNIGEEPTKGNALTQSAHRLLADAADGLNFVGNVEGRDIFDGKADVVVCDGFTGNVILKLAESILTVGGGMISQAVRRRWSTTLGALLIKPALVDLKRHMDYETYGGALLLGTRGICVIGHGRSSARAIANAIAVAARSVRSELEEAINRAVEAEGATQLQVLAGAETHDATGRTT
jgi:phosphate acyltransferase